MGLFESVRERELRLTRQSFEQVEALHRASPLHQHGASGLALGMMGDLLRVAGRLPNSRIFMALFEASIDVLEGEELGAIEPTWDLIARDVSAAVAFRAMLARRRRWAAEFDERSLSVRRYLVGLWKSLAAAMPEHCFREPGAEERAVFDVPLVEMLQRPAEQIERAVVFAFADEFIRDEMFEGLRGQLRRNLLRASGLSMEANWADVRSRIVMPTQTRGRTSAELVDLYLDNTPFKAVFEAPAPFEIPDQVRFEHGHILGGTGAGKTQLLQRMIHADLVRATTERRSVIVIDSQGDLINKLLRLDLFSPDRENSLADRLVLIDPADVEHPPALNLFDPPLSRLKAYGAADRERVLNGAVELYETLFGDMLGAELTQKQGVIFRYLARLMVSLPGATIHTLMQLMEDGRPFRPQMEQLEGSARYFFQTEFFHPSFAATKKQILRRLWGVLSTPAFERMFAQRANKLDLFAATREGKIILISTAKELLKRDGSALMGRFFINLLAQTAIERAVLPAEERTPTFVYVDEAQEYFDDGVATILQQARKYQIGLVAAHQSLDQATVGVRAALLSNTSFKCVSGVSARDARVLADELRTTPDFIEGMRRREGTTEFAAWVKHETPQAIRLTVPLGYLERQPVLTEEAYDELVERNRAQYCGTLEEVQRSFDPPERTSSDEAEAAPLREVRPPRAHWTAEAPQDDAGQPPSRPISEEPLRSQRTELGKGGAKHRYLQALVKELAEQQGFKATIESPLSAGQVDVLLERDDLRIAVEVSVTTPVAWERENLRKCLAHDFQRVALVLAKSQMTAKRYRDAIVEGLSEADRARLVLLNPEDLPDFIAALSPTTDALEPVVKGYRVKVSRTDVSPEEVRLRREALARLVAQSLGRQGDR